MKIIKKERPIAYILFSVIIAVGIALDQITKAIAVKFLQPVSDVPIIKNIFHLTFVTNDGAAFNLFSDNRWIMMIISTIAIIGMALYLYFGHSGSLLAGASMAAIISGGLGNMIDRTFRGDVIFDGKVVDFINTCFVRYPKSLDQLTSFHEWEYFPVFNVADCFVCVGAGLLIFSLLIDIVKERREKREAAETKEEE
jgi:signal peptidase II